MTVYLEITLMADELRDELLRRPRKVDTRSLAGVGYARQAFPPCQQGCRYTTSSMHTAENSQ